MQFVTTFNEPYFVNMTAFFAWDHERVDKVLVRQIVERQHGRLSIGVLDASAHAKQGKYTPGVQRQWGGICFIRIMTHRILSVALLPAIFSLF